MENYFDNNDWKAQRLGRFTASECHKLFAGGRKKDEYFGLGALTFIRTKVAELLTMDLRDDLDFKQAEWGKAHEAAAVKFFEEKTGKQGTYYGVENPVFFPYGEYAGGSPDWEIEGEEGADVKCPYNSAVHIENLQINSVEEFKEKRWEYYCQAQANMLIRGWKKFYFVSYDPRMPEMLKLKVIVVMPDEAWVKEYQERLEKATVIVTDTLNSFDNPSVLICHYEEDVQATIVENANV